MDEELNKEFSGNLSSELDECVKEMKMWCLSPDAQDRCPHPCHTLSDPYIMSWWSQKGARRHEREHVIENPET